MMSHAGRLAGSVALLALVALPVSSHRSGVAMASPGFPPGFGPPPQVVHDYVLQSTRRISRTLFEYTYQAYVSNWDDHDVTVTASLLSVPANATVVEGTLDFGFVPQGATVKASDTFTIRHQRSAPLDEDALLWAVQATPADLTSYELIDQASSNGEIDDETVLVYKVFADFDDERLPVQYRGREDSIVDGRAIEGAERHFAELSQANQDLLAPFLMRPDEPGSWVEVQAANGPPAAALSGSGALAAAVPPIEWDRYPVVINGTTKAWVWWKKNWPSTEADRSRAGLIVTELESYLWNKLTSAFQEPAPDDVISVGGSQNPLPHGVDGQLDIYLTGLRRSVARPAWAGCNKSPHGNYILLEQGAVRPTVAHELMHAIIAAYPLLTCSDTYHWMNEATATWAEHFAYDGPLPLVPQDTEHAVAPAFLRKPQKPWDPAFLDDPKKCRQLNPTDPDTGEPLHLEEGLCGYHQYGAYLWFLNLTEGKRASAADAGPVKNTWTRAQYVLPTEAISTGTENGGFRKTWQMFVANNWNRLKSGYEPHRDYFKWDDLDQQAYEQDDGPKDVKLPVYYVAIQPIFHQLPPLSTQYNHFDFTKDPKVRQVWYYNDYAGSDPRVDVQAVVKVQGKWKQAESWSGDRKKVFCRDDPTQDIQELVLITSNMDLNGASDPSSATKLGGPDTKDNSPLRLVYSPVPCHDWVGPFSFHTVDSSENGDSITTTASASNLRFRFDPATSDPIPASGFTYFEAVQGDVDWHIEYSRSGCTNAQFAGSFPAAGRLLIAPTGTGLFYGLFNTSPGTSDEDTVLCTGGLTTYQESFSAWMPSTSVVTTNTNVLEGSQEGWIWRLTEP